MNFRDVRLQLLLGLLCVLTLWAVVIAFFAFVATPQGHPMRWSRVLASVAGSMMLLILIAVIVVVSFVAVVYDTCTGGRH